MMATLTCAAGIVSPPSASAQPAPAADVNGDGRVTVDDLESSVIQIQAAMSAGRVTSEGLTRAYLGRIKKYDDAPRLGPLGPPNAVLTLNRHAIAEARALDRARAAHPDRSPLYGVPVLLKDNIGTRDMPTTAGCRCLRDNRPGDDSVVVQRLRRAGAVILGKTNLDEFAVNTLGASSLGGLTLNAYSPGQSSGGSSGGSAVSVALAFSTLAFGTDTGGSVRTPSSWNSVVGVRPSTGVVSRTGVIPLALSQDTVGPIARNVSDAAIALAVIAGRDPADQATSAATKVALAQPVPHALKGAVIGVASNLNGDDPATRAIMDDSIRTLRRAGAIVRTVAVTPPRFESGSSFEIRPEIDAYLAGQAGPSARGKTLAELVNSGQSLLALDPRTPARLGVTDAQYRTQLVAHQRRIGSYRTHLTRLMDSAGLDAIVYPTTPGPPTGLAGDNVYIAPLSGMPAVTVPAGYRYGSGREVSGATGIEFLGRRFADSDLLSLAADFDRLHHARVRPVP